MFDQKPLQYIFLSVTLLLYLVVGFAFPRYETTLLLISYGTLFGIYCWIIFRIKENEVQFWFYAAILFRFSLLFSIPTLSDDFYRFIWDGRLLASGYHPFSHVPSHYIENKISIPGIEEALFVNLNSKNYFTVYPPVAQFIFWISAACSSSIYGSLLILKVIIFLSEIGSIILIQKLLSHFKFPVTRLFVYALNPLVILELSGNAHLEGVMIFFLLLSLYLLVVHNKFLLSAIAFATSICIKLIPLLFLPAVLLLFGFKKAALFYLSVLLTCLIFSLPLWDLDILTGYQNSFPYYFSKFEFNASIYYIVRELGFLLFGYNIIQTAGWILGVLAGILILLVATHWLRAPHAWYFKHLKNPSSNNTVLSFIYLMMWSLFIYFLFTTTLHPWYITTLLLLSVFTDFRFVIVWTAVIFLTYTGYDRQAFKENLWIVAFEYATILGYLAYELARKRNQALLTA